jgi:hypothetical protein
MTPETPGTGDAATPMPTGPFSQSRPSRTAHHGRGARLLLSISAIALLGFQIVRAHDVISLVGAYGFSEGSGTTTLDASGNSSPGVLLNGATWIAGKYGFGASFDGVNDFISIPDSPSLQLGHTGTVEAWVRLDVRNRWNAVLGKASSDDDADHNYAIEIDPTNRPICLIGNGTSANYAKSTTALAAQRFYHLACTWDGTKLRFYLDGVLKTTTNQTITPASTGGPLVIGQFGGNVDYIDGIVDEVRIFNVAVSQANIQIDMNTAVEATPDTVPPTVSMASPSENATVSGNVALVATAADDRVVAGVRFFVDGVQVEGEDTATPYSATWDTRTAANGPHTLTASARDAAGNTTVSAPRIVNVSNLPQLVITQPVNGAAPSGSTLAVTYLIAGDVTGLGVNHVHFQVDGGPEIMDMPPIDGTKTLNNVSPGAHTLSGFLVRSDHTKINGTDAAPVAFTMVVPDNNPPSVSITNPTDGSAVSGVVALSATATDDIGIAGVRFLIDGTGVGAEDTAPPYSVQWSAVGSGAHVVTAIARDASNNSTTSNPIAITVSDPNDPAVIGQWSSVMNWPLVAVHSTLMPTGEILMWDGWELPNAAAKVWNPTTNTFYNTPVSAGVFCAAQAILADGKVLVIGGHAGGEIGIPDTFTFDPFTRAWARAPYMNFSRWYPSATRLGDGRVLALSGQLVPGSWIDTPEIFDPRTNVWTNLNNAQTGNMHDPEYPLSFLLPDGTIYSISALLGQAYTLTVSPQSWSSPSAIPQRNGSAAMYRPGKILMTGGGTYGTGPSQPGAAVVDPAGAGAAWRNVAPMAHGRYQHNLVVLADGSVLAVGGSDITTLVTSGTNGVLPAELWSPTTETWATMAAMRDPRMYHSTAMLLPDGRVLAAGGGRLGSIPSFPTAEIFSPPYLFRGARPTITNAPASATLGDGLTIETPDAANISRVAIVPLGAVTHTLNMNQTFVDLPFTTAGTTLQVQMPVNTNATPPGYYLLFILNNAGVPAIAPFLRVMDSATIDSTPPAVAIVNPYNGQAVSGTVAVGADASDNVGVSSVQFQLDGTNLGAADTEAPFSMSWNSALALDGSHSLTAIARDAAGNVATSTSVAVTVVNSGGGGDKYLGHTVVGSIVDSGDAHHINASRFVMPAENGIARSLSVYVAAPVNAAPNNQFQVAIYADQGGVPGALITSSASQTITPGAWNTVPVSANLTANTAYWLAYNTNATSGNANNLTYDLGASGQWGYRVQTYGTWPGSFGGAALAAAKASIYVTYEAAAP